MTQTLKSSAQAVEKLSPIFNRQIANCAVLFMKLHNYHWYVKGTDFFTLHEKFEELYDEVKQNLDDLAERLLTMGGQPIGDLKACLQETSLQEATTTSGVSATQMVQNIIQDFEIITNELDQGIEMADELGDQVTSDLLLGMNGSLQKHMWMLKAHIG